MGAIGRDSQNFQRQPVVEPTRDRAAGDRHRTQHVSIVGSTHTKLAAYRRRVVPMVNSAERAGLRERHGNQSQTHTSRCSRIRS